MQRILTAESSGAVGVVRRLNQSLAQASQQHQVSSLYSSARTANATASTASTAIANNQLNVRSITIMAASKRSTSAINSATQHRQASIQSQTSNRKNHKLNAKHHHRSMHTAISKPSHASFRSASAATLQRSTQVQSISQSMQAHTSHLHTLSHSENFSSINESHLSNPTHRRRRAVAANDPAAKTAGVNPRTSAPQRSIHTSTRAASNSALPTTGASSQQRRNKSTNALNSSQRRLATLKNATLPSRPRALAACQSRLYSSAILSKTAASIQNGIMAQDDYFINGIPENEFKLDADIDSDSKSNAKGEAANHSSSSSTTTRTATRTSTPVVHSVALDRIFAEHSNVDPFHLIKDDLITVSQHIQQLIGSDHAILSSVANYFFNVNGKRIRPAIVLLMAKALQAGVKHPNGNGKSQQSTNATQQQQSNQNESPEEIPSSSHDLPSGYGVSVLPTQQRLSEICELIHTASLLHDDVIDNANTRRNIQSINGKYGNKLAILGGDFLLARASVALARLRDPNVIELLSCVIEHLVKGEMMQMKPGKIISTKNHKSPENGRLASVNHYMTKTYYKTASLIANSCKAVSILARPNDTQQSLIAYSYGKCIGLAFQVRDDVLDVVGDQSVTGKETGLDLTAGIMSAPLLFALGDNPALAECMERKFSAEGDREFALSCIHASDAIGQSHQLAVDCAEGAVASLQQLNDSPAKSALITLVKYVLERNK